MLKTKLLLPCPDLLGRGITGYFKNLMKNKSLLTKIHKERHFADDFKPFMDLKLRLLALARVT